MGVNNPCDRFVIFDFTGKFPLFTNKLKLRPTRVKNVVSFNHFLSIIHSFWETRAQHWDGNLTWFLYVRVFQLFKIVTWCAFFLKITWCAWWMYMYTNQLFFFYIRKMYTNQLRRGNKMILPSIIFIKKFWLFKFIE